MAIDARPDLLGALTARLRSFNELLSLVGADPPRISPVLQEGWAMPTHAVLLRAAGGPPGIREVNLLVTRLDVFCYGPGKTPQIQAREAMRLWRLVDPCLCPGHERAAGFTQAGCRVYSIDEERAPTSEVEPDTGWARVSCSYLVRWNGIAV